MRATPNPPRPGRSGPARATAHHPRGAWTAVALLWPLLWLGCEAEPEVPVDFGLTLQVWDEDGRPIEGARVEWLDSEARTNARGRARLGTLDGPQVALVSGPGYLTEPVPVGWNSADAVVDVTLLDASGRVVMHHGGDSMFGRRYTEPKSGAPLIGFDDTAGAASDVVAHLARPFSIADFRSLNLETVVSERTLEQAYPGKRFLLRSEPDTLAALETLQVDMVSFANNHTRDWMDDGVADSLRALDTAGIPHVGGGMEAGEAETALIQEVAGLRIGTLAYTTVTGSFVNDNYPDADTAPPDDLEEKDAWMFQTRAFLFDDAAWPMPQGEYRIGEVWRSYSGAERDLDEDTRARAWAAIVETFPEMQDWVARRGHGGAAMWQRARADDVATLSAVVDVTIVQLHAGYQFQTAPSESVAAAARLAIDAGADIVIAHHPHVLQGMEWYKDHLIVYSLGNFIFDQDFLATFRSGFVRTVWEGDELVQARFVPLDIVGYRPTPTVDVAATQNMTMVWERSVMGARAARDAVTHGVYVFAADLDADTVPAQLLMEHNTARLVKHSMMLPATIRVGRDTTVELPDFGLIPGDLGIEAGESPGVQVGRRIFGWGRFEDELADGPRTDGDAHWSLTYEDKQVVVGNASSGRGMLRMLRDDRNMSVLGARPVARIPLSDHRLHASRQEQGLPPEALDPAAHHSMRFRARCRGHCDAYLRLDIYDFDDTNPTEDPGSELLGEHREPLFVKGSEWRSYEVDIDLRAWTGSDRANMMMFYLQLEPTETGEAILDIDELEVIEWRDAQGMPHTPGAFTHARNSGETVTLSFDVLTAQE